MNLDELIHGYKTIVDANGNAVPARSRMRVWGAEVHDSPDDQTTNIQISGSGSVPTSRAVAAGAGLSGGGTLDADRTLSVAIKPSGGVYLAPEGLAVTLDSSTMRFESFGALAVRAHPRGGVEVASNENGIGLAVRLRSAGGLVFENDGINFGQLAIDTTRVAGLSAGKLIAGQARGISLLRHYAQKNSTSYTVNTANTYIAVAAAQPLGACSVDDLIKAIYQCNATGTGSQHVLRIRISNSATPDLAASAGASVKYETYDYFAPPAGGMHSIEVRHAVATTESLWLHVLARMGTGPAWSITDKELFAEIYRL